MAGLGQVSDTEVLRGQGPPHVGAAASRPELTLRVEHERRVGSSPLPKRNED